MGYYGDLFLRPKQAVMYALQNPSMVRSVGFVLLGTIAGLLSSLIFAGQIFFDSVLLTLVGDFARWLLGGIVLLLLGMVFRGIPLNPLNISRALSVLAQLNVYGFFMFLILGLILPAIVIPDLISATNQLNNDVIGPEEYTEVLSQSLAASDGSIFLSLPLILISMLLILYSLYVLFLSFQKYLDVTVFKSIVGVFILLILQSIFIILIGGGL